jgi:hypothetical protein
LGLFREKKKKANQLKNKKIKVKIFEPHAKWRVSSEMNIEWSVRRLKRGVKQISTL